MKLGGKTIAGKDASGNNSSSTVTTSSSQKKPISNVVNLKHSSSSKLSSTANTNSVGSVVSKHVSVNPNQSLRGPNNISSDTKYSLRGEVKGDRRSTSSKSSVGSSYSLERKLEGVDSAASLATKRRIQSNEGSSLVNILKDTKRQIPDRISSSKNQKKVADAKIAIREPKPKGLSSALSRKPLHPVNEAVPAKVRTASLATQPRQSAAAGKLNFVSVGSQKIVAERKTQYSKTLKPSGMGLKRSTLNGISGYVEDPFYELKMHIIASTICEPTVITAKQILDNAGLDLKSFPLVKEHDLLDWINRTSSVYQLPCPTLP